MEIVGYVAAVLIGVSLGLIGGGGSILTVPVLVYLFGIGDAVLATGYSLFIVGGTSLVGAFRAMAQKKVEVKMAIVFAIPSLVSVFLTRRFLLPAIPDLLLKIGEFELTKSKAMMLLFAAIMIAAASKMIRKKTTDKHAETERITINYLAIAAQGLLIGLLTALVGAGGGFLIVPVLVLFAKLPMKTAVGTSLLIIGINSLIGFLGDLGAKQNFDWPFLLTLSGIAIAGIFLGGWLSNFIDSKKLKTGFGYFVLAMAAFVLISEFVN